MLTPKGFRLHIGIFGRRNVGKSSLLNALTRQSVSVVSEVAGTTTDPVEKPMEWLPLGPVLFIDTAGIDDVGSLGELRIAKTLQVIDRIDIALLLTDSVDGEWGTFEQQLATELTQRGIPFIAVRSQCDRDNNSRVHKVHPVYQVHLLHVSSLTGFGLDALREAIVRAVPEACLVPPPLVADIVGAGGVVVLVVPIDKEAPRGRLILPQVQTIRDILDGDAWCIVAKEGRVAEVLATLRTVPSLVVTDSQAFREVAAIVPESVPLTSFSILFARQKGDMTTFIAGARRLLLLKPKSRILIAESCTHRPIEEDIGTVKIPRLLRQRFGDDIIIEHRSGHNLPDRTTLVAFDLVIHCGGCMTNRREMLSRIAACDAAGVAITNYGLAIAALLGILDRAVKPFSHLANRHKVPGWVGQESKATQKARKT